MVRLHRAYRHDDPLFGCEHNAATSRREIIIKFRFLGGLRQRERLKSHIGKSSPAERRVPRLGTTPLFIKGRRVQSSGPFKATWPIKWLWVDFRLRLTGFSIGL